MTLNKIAQVGMKTEVRVSMKEEDKDWRYN